MFATGATEVGVLICGESSKFVIEIFLSYSFYGFHLKFCRTNKEKYHVFVLEAVSSGLTDVSVLAVTLYLPRPSTLGFARLHLTVLTRDFVFLQIGHVGEEGGI